jgi:TolA-binding protein
VREELRALRSQNEELAARVERLSTQVDLLTARMTRGADPARAASPQVVRASDPAGVDSLSESTDGEVPPSLTIVRVSPPGAPAPRGAGRGAARPRVAPPVPTSVAIQEPDLSALDDVGRPGRRPIAAEADAELRAARALAGVSRAHALEDFTTHFPQHPSADNALVEASAAYAAAGNDGAACALARRALDEYPAGDAQSDALETLAGCELRRGDPGAAQKLLDRLRADFPGTSAARRAEARLSSNPGRDGAPSRELPARSGP